MSNSELPSTIVEAKQYFRSLGERHSLLRKVSIEKAGKFLESERSGDVYREGLRMLKLSKIPVYHAMLREEGAAFIGVMHQFSQSMADESNKPKKGDKRVVTTSDSVARDLKGNQALFKLFDISRREGNNFFRYARGGLLLGAMLELRKGFDQLDNLPAGDKFGDALEVMKFRYTHPLAIERGGVSIWDLYTEQFHKRSANSDRILQYISMFFAGVGGRETLGDSLAAIDKDNRSKITREFPALTRSAIIDAFSLTPAILSHSPSSIERALPDAKDYDTTYIDNFRHLWVQMNRLRTRVQEYLFDDRHGGGEVVRNSLLNSLDSGGPSLVAILLCVDMVDKQEVIELYRKSKLKIGQHKLFEIIADFLRKEVLNPEFNSAQVVTSEDIEDILTPDCSRADEKVPTMKDIAQGIDLVRKDWLSQQDLLSLDLDWDQIGLVKPHELAVFSPSGSPFDFRLLLGYQNEETGENLNLWLTFNTKKIDGFDWSVIDPPSLYPEYKNKFMILARSILAELNKKKLESLNKRSLENPSPQRDRLYETRMKFEESNEVETRNRLTAQLDSTSEKAPSVRRVVLYTDDELAEHLEGIDSQYHPYIEGKLVAFNNGSARLKKLQGKKDNGEVIRRIDAGWYRILVKPKEVPAEERDPGVIPFSICKIELRRDVYKRK